MSDRNQSRTRWRWEEERERSDYRLTSERRFAHHGGDPRWGTGGMRESRSARSDVAPSSQPHGPYAGRGPRGYRRSDERIREDICDRLTDDGDVDATEILVTVARGEVTLRGNVPTEEQRDLAERIADSTSGVIEVHNQIRIQRPGGSPPGLVPGYGSGLGSFDPSDG